MTHADVARNEILQQLFAYRGEHPAAYARVRENIADVSAVREFDGIVDWLRQATRSVDHIPLARTVRIG